MGYFGRRGGIGGRGLGMLIPAAPRWNRGSGAMLGEAPGVSASNAASSAAATAANAASQAALSATIAARAAERARYPGGAATYAGGGAGGVGPAFGQDAMIPGPGGTWWPRDVNQRLYLPNVFDWALFDEQGLWQAIQDVGGLQAICPGQRYALPPWVKQPEQARRFSKISSIPLPAVEQVDYLVATMQVPLGYDGVIPSVVNMYTGQGFNEGSGDLIWRIRLNQRYVKDYSNITTTIGSLTTPYPANTGAVRLLSGQTVNYYVMLGAGALGNLNGGRIVTAMLGWWWPR